MNFSSGNITDNSSSIISSSSNTSSTESVILPIVPTTDDIIVGVAMTVSSILCIIPNVVVLKVGFYEFFVAKYIKNSIFLST
jgi:hypothetical protein